MGEVEGREREEKSLAPPKNWFTPYPHTRQLHLGQGEKVIY
jgi:hypothetical protein